MGVETFQKRKNTLLKQPLYIYAFVRNSSNGGSRMHPVWVQKIEDARRKSVMMFWGSMFFVVVLPILIMFRADFFMLVAMICFGAAGVRAYLGARPQAVSRAPVKRVPQQPMPVTNQAVTMPPGMQPQQAIQMQMGGQAMRPQAVMGTVQQGMKTISAHHQQVPQPQAASPGQSVADGFFKVSMDPGQPLIPHGVLPEATSAQTETIAPGSSEAAPAEPVEEQPIFRSMHFHDIALGKRTPPTAPPEPFQ